MLPKGNFPPSFFSLFFTSKFLPTPVQPGGIYLTSGDTSSKEENKHLPLLPTGGQECDAPAVSFENLQQTDHQRANKAYEQGDLRKEKKELGCGDKRGGA